MPATRKLPSSRERFSGSRKSSSGSRSASSPGPTWSELQRRPPPQPASLLVQERRRAEIFDRQAERLEERDLAIRFAPLGAAGQQLADLGADVLRTRDRSL